MKYFIIPLEAGREAKISQWFGQTLRNYKSLGLNAHNGVDFPVPEGTNVLACGDGTVVEIYDQATKAEPKNPHAMWNYVKIQHDGYASIYGHLQYKGVLVKIGDKVEAGQKIALSGNTGYSTGPHLHWALKETDKNGDTLNKDNGFNGAINPLSLVAPREPVSELPIIKGKELADWEKDIFDFIAEREKKSNYILKDTKGFISDMTPYKVLALLINSNPQLKEDFTLFLNKKHGV